jgi:hypothetical protein
MNKESYTDIAGCNMLYERGRNPLRCRIRILQVKNSYCKLLSLSIDRHEAPCIFDLYLGGYVPCSLVGFASPKVIPVNSVTVGAGGSIPNE